MKVTKEITVYATSHRTIITADPKDLIPTAVDSGNIYDFATWLDNYYSAQDILNLIEEGIDPKEQVDQEYVEYCTRHIEYLVDNEPHWWKDTITVEVEVN